MGPIRTPPGVYIPKNMPLTNDTQWPARPNDPSPCAARGFHHDRRSPGSPYVCTDCGTPYPHPLSAPSAIPATPLAPGPLAPLQSIGSTCPAVTGGPPPPRTIASSPHTLPAI